MRQSLRVGVIGAGGIGLEHLESLGRCPQAIITGLAETSPERLEQAARKYSIRSTHRDYRALLADPSIDAVTIALPNHLHAPVALAALRADKHVFLEKPMAMNAAEAARVVRLAARRHRTLMVGHNFRFHPETVAARTCVGRGALGTVYHARAFWLRQRGIPRIGSWFTQKRLAGGGCIADIGVHMLDTCLHVLDDFDVATVSAQTHARFGPRGRGEMDWGRSEIEPRRPFDVEDFGTALLRFRSGRSLLLEVSWAAHLFPSGRDFGVDLLGTEGSLSLFPGRLLRPTRAGTLVSKPLAPRPAAHGEDRFEHWVSCALSGRAVRVPPSESLQLQRILDALYRSAALHREVPFAPAPRRRLRA